MCIRDRVRRGVEGMLSEDVGVLLVEGRERIRADLYDVTDLLHALLREQEVRRVHVAGLHEAPRLLRAPARVRPVHESALVGHEVVQVAARPGQTLPEVLGVNPRPCAHLMSRTRSTVSGGYAR